MENFLTANFAGGVRWKTNWRISDRVYLQNVLAGSLLRQEVILMNISKPERSIITILVFYRRFTVNDSLSLTYRGDGWSLVSITTLQHIDDNMTLDQDFLPLSYFTLTQKQRETALTEDVVVKGTRNEGKYKWLAGFFGFSNILT